MSETSIKLYSAAQVGELDRRMIEEQGVPGFDLMQRAAEAAYQQLRRHWPRARRLAVFCGPGNNGGDGFLIARLALRDEMQVRLYFLGDRDKSKGDAAAALLAYEQAGGRLQDMPDSLPDDADLIIDAMLGTGLGRDVEGRFKQAVDLINSAPRDVGVFAVDMPSGLDADTGKVWGVAVRADATATFIGRKLGHYTGAGPGLTGALQFHDLGAEPAVYRDIDCLARRVDRRQIKEALPRRPADAHKGQNGHLLCVGGNLGMAGAVRMCAEAALRVGAGLVSVATRPEYAATMVQARPELMCRGVEAPAELDVPIEKAGVIAVGPGLGQDGWGRALFGKVLDSNRPLVVDADALNLLAAEPVARGRWVLTPHPGEAARLLDTDTAHVQADRPAAAAELARRYDATIVLKGAGSLIQGARDGLWLCTAGNPGMAVGGMGDILTGVVAGLLAQGLAPESAARVGTYLHAAAGDHAARDGERGLLPSDLFTALRLLANPGE